jgi:hypothetical protein
MKGRTSPIRQMALAGLDAAAKTLRLEPGGEVIAEGGEAVRSYRLMPRLNQMCTQWEGRQSVTAQLRSFRDCRCSPASGGWKFRVDPCQTARLVEHVMAVSD